ncbi:MAG: hypothetical protein E7022_08230 [Desulfovibrio desulfuricans]|nr:hypothetical protein [Desulfovibrio desulfuricans]
MYYFAIIYPSEEGTYVVDFPDFPEAFTSGKTLDECMVMAADALSITVEEYSKANRKLPTPSGIEDIRKKAAHEMATAEGLDTSREPLFQMFPAPEVDMTPVKISVSFARSVLAGIDAKAKQRGMTRSGFLAAAAQAF